MSYDRRRAELPDITGMTSLKVDNIPPGTVHEDLRRLFEKFGEIGDVHIPKNYDRYGEIRGFAYIRFYDSRDAKDAMEGMDGRRYENRELRVQIERNERPEKPRWSESRESRERHQHSRRSGSSEPMEISSDNSMTST